MVYFRTGKNGSSAGYYGRKTVLEKKQLNDAFFKADFCGRPCFVKCSSKCPWTIGNEYRMAQRMYSAAPDIVAEPLAFSENPAFCATAYICGPSLADRIRSGISSAEADSYANDILALANALEREGIVHRDLYPDNFLLGEDGRLKVIDWQLAIDRRDYREDPWVVRNWKFHYVFFGVNRDLGPGNWNDCFALARIVDAFPTTPGVAAVAAELRRRAPSSTFSAPPSAMDSFRLKLYAVSLRMQMCLRNPHSRRYRKLERKLLTISGRFAEEIDV